MLLVNIVLPHAGRVRSVVKLRHSLSAALTFGALNLEPVSGYVTRGSAVVPH